MMKKTVLALSTIAMLGAAAPAMAGAFGEGDTDWTASRFQSSLQQRGVNATRVTEWGDYIQATVKLSTGGSEYQYFDPDTFERVSF